ncbi:MAG: hypothetical protein RIF41_08190 [Polyangiaceae bacterium]
MNASRTPPCLMLVAVFALSGCEDTPKERLEGRWIGDSVESFHPAQASRAAGWATGLSFSFKGSRVTVAIPAESARQGTYKIAQATEDELRIRFHRNTGATDEATFRFEGEDRLRWVLGDGRSVLLRKEVVD